MNFLLVLAFADFFKQFTLDLLFREDGGQKEDHVSGVLHILANRVELFESDVVLERVYTGVEGIDEFTLFLAGMRVAKDVEGD